MTNPYRIEGPACISFSGGRTSAYMLRQILDAHGGTLPPNVHVIFCNTGKEYPGCYDFVLECSDRWSVAIRWLEWRPNKRRGDDPNFVEVGHATASRNGEPFAALVRKRRALPDLTKRFCTEELKIKTAKRWMVAQGYRQWVNVVGLRADEPHRVARRKASKPDTRSDLAFPLYAAGVTKADVLAFWAAQPFDLRERNRNCDLCFMKPVGHRMRVMADEPERADWWIERERERDATFVSPVREPGGYSMLRAAARHLPLYLPFDEPDGVDCACTD